MYKREESEDVCQQIARFLYTSAIPFNVVKNPQFSLMIEEIGRYEIGLKPPSYHEIREKFLKQEVFNVMQLLEEQKLEWKKKRCTIMSNGWTDRKRRSICNFLVNNRFGCVCLSSIDTSHISKTTDAMLQIQDSIVERVREENVVQIVTNNAANYKAVGEMLMEKRKRLFWTPCAAHCIDLMLEDLDKKIRVHGEAIAKGRRVTTFIYSRTMVLTCMKEFTGGRDLIWPAVTHFTTSYLTLRCLNQLKGGLLTIFTSEKWKSSRFAKLAEGKKVTRIVLDTRGFWKNVTTCLKAALPLVKVLRMVDSDDKPAMGFIYDAMDRAKNQIKENFNNVQWNYGPILRIIDDRWEAQLHRPLHAACYFSNPHFHYSPDFKSDFDIKIGLYRCLQKMVPDAQGRVKIDLQLDSFKNAKGLFGMPTTVAIRKKKSPGLVLALIYLLYLEI